MFTGNGGAGIALAAAATASSAAASGMRTLLVSIGPSHSLSSLFGVPVGAAPLAIGPNLEAWTIDVLAELSAFWQLINKDAPASSPQRRINGDELPLIPGVDLLIGLARIREHAANGYDLLVIEVGSQEGLLRALAVPDGFRWTVRVMFGLDRGPGRSSASVGRAIVPTTFLPFDWMGQVQDTRVGFEDIRDEMSDSNRTSVRYVLRPDEAALEEARIAVPALHLHGLAVDGLLAGPLLPATGLNGTLAAVAAQQQRVMQEASQLWAPRPLFALPFTASERGSQTLGELGKALYDGQEPAAMYTSQPPIERGDGPNPFVAIDLPGLQREALGLTLSGDELIVRAGPYRRHLLLHDALRGVTNIRATREGSRLIVRPR
jgi:anion-transporting  ArsA/GET3 family ATPase